MDLVHCQSHFWLAPASENLIDLKSAIAPAALKASTL